MLLPIPFIIVAYGIYYLLGYELFEKNHKSAILFVIIMSFINIYGNVIFMEERIPTYEELDDEEKEVLDAFRQMKMLCDISQFKYHRLQLENLIKDY